MLIYVNTDVRVIKERYVSLSTVTLLKLSLQKKCGHVAVETLIIDVLSKQISHIL